MGLEKLHSEPVKDDWLDPYGHLNEAYYLVGFANAAWTFMDFFDIGPAYTERTGCGFYTVETHLRYLQEVRAPAVMEIEAMIFETDKKRCHYGMIMRVDDVERATFESLLLHVDTNAGRTAPIPDDVIGTLNAAKLTDPPDWVGRSISLSK